MLLNPHNNTETIFQKYFELIFDSLSPFLAVAVSYVAETLASEHHEAQVLVFSPFNLFQE